MNWLAIFILVVLAFASAALYHNLKKSFTLRHQERLGKVLPFGFLYVLLNISYFFLLFWFWESISLNDIKFPGRRHQLLGILLVLIFPLLVQAKIFPLLRKKGYSFKSLRLSIDLALLLSIISLFFRDTTPDFSKTKAFYFTGIAVYFTFSKVLIEWLILADDIEVKD